MAIDMFSLEGKVLHPDRNVQVCDIAFGILFERGEQRSERAVEDPVVLVFVPALVVLEQLVLAMRR